MKRILLTVALSAIALAANPAALFAQTAEEIVSKMDDALRPSDTEGCYFVMEMKIPLLGTVAAASYVLGDRLRVETEMQGEIGIDWTDGVTNWLYSSKDNTVTIENAKTEEKAKDADENLGLFKNITEGYDVKISGETADSWSILCTKSKSNKNKDDPKKMDLVVAKATYLPLSLKSSLKGVTMTMRDIRVGVSEDEVTFNPAKYPDAKIVDKR